MNILERKSFEIARAIEPLMIHDHRPAKPFDTKSVCLDSVQMIAQYSQTMGNDFVGRHGLS
jgi:hypothetical protein